MKKSFKDWYSVTLKARDLLNKKYNIITDVSECENNGNRYKKKRYELGFYVDADITQTKTVLYTGTLEEIDAFLKGFELSQTGVRP